MAHIGRSISIRGTVTGQEDLEIDGEVEGRIELANDELTIGPEGRVVAELRARSIVILGRVQGNVTAVERIVVRGSGVVEGDLAAPRLTVEEGARLEGAIQMQPEGARGVSGAVRRPSAVALGSR